MNVQNANAIREYWTTKFLEFLQEQGEDVGQFATNGLNFPIVFNDDEGWVEVMIKVPKHDEGYEKRQEYQIKLAETAEKAKKAQQEKEKKIKKDKKRREQKAEVEGETA